MRFHMHCVCIYLQLENWTSSRSSTSSSSNKPEVLLHVPAGELEVGQLLVKIVYQKQPMLSDASQEQLLQLLLLTDRYSVPRAVPAIAAAFRATPVEQLEWATALNILQLPNSCTEQEIFKDIV